MAVDTEQQLRFNEQKLRRCDSVDKAKLLVPSLILEPSSSSLAELATHGKSSREVYRFVHLEDFVYYIPSFLSKDEVLRLSDEILNKMIDSPPHSNSLGNVQTKRMWRDHGDPSREGSLNKLRWSCVGYHYNWTDRSYDPGKKSDFPDSLKSLFENALSTINDTVNSTEKVSLLKGEPQSAIINFYHSHRISDRLGGHRDDVEATDSTPLVCLSLGLPAILLIEDQAIVVRSGDAIVMADKARQSLHGVPCILHDTIDRRGSTPIDDENLFDRKKVEDFLNRTRISISIRQVY